MVVTKNAKTPLSQCFVCPFWATVETISMEEIVNPKMVQIQSSEISPPGAYTRKVS